MKTERSWINSTKLNQKFQNRVIKGLRSSSSGEWVTNNAFYDVTYQYNWHRRLERCASSDWSRIASYLALIASQEMIIAGTGCLAFWLCFHGSDKRGKRKLNCEEHKNGFVYGGTFFKGEIWIVCRFNWLNLQNLLAYHDTNDHNCHKICAMLSLFAEFTKEFERSCAIILQQLFASSSVKIVV